MKFGRHTAIIRTVPVSTQRPTDQVDQEWETHNQ